MSAINEDEIVVSDRLTIAVNAESADKLGSVAYDIAEAINVIREQTNVDFVLDVQIAVPGPQPQLGQTGAIGFKPEEEYYEEGDE